MSTDGCIASENRFWSGLLCLVVVNSGGQRVAFCALPVPVHAVKRAEGSTQRPCLSNAPYTYCPPTLSTGSGGVYVQALQDILNTNYLLIGNYVTSPKPWTTFLPSDGSFGPQTYAAVYDWQSLMLLSKDGVVGPATWTSLFMCYY